MSTKSGYLLDRQIMVHIIVTEKALGKKLPKGAEVHHVDCNKLNNANNNLVICPSKAYHKLLHVRTKALEISGNANYRRCTFCKIYDDPVNLYSNHGNFRHRSCASDYQKQHKLKRKYNGI